MTIVVLNAQTGGVSEYALDPVTVSAGVDDAPRFATDDGVLAFADLGAGQEAVTGVVEWGLMDFGSLVRKNASQVVLELSGEQEATLTLVNDTLGSQVEYDYPVPAQQAYARRWPVLCGKGVASDAIGLRFTGGDAVQWRLAGCEVNIDPRRGIR